MRGAMAVQPCGMAELRYAVILEPDNGAFSVIVPAFPEVHTFGATKAKIYRRPTQTPLG